MNKGKIGNDEQVHIWKDRWTHHPISFKVYSAVRIIDENPKVKHLIKLDTHHWKQTLINQIFSKIEAETINKIPLSFCNSQANLIWRCTTNDQFSKECLSPITRNTRQICKEGFKK